MFKMFGAPLYRSRYMEEVPNGKEGEGGGGGTGQTDEEKATAAKAASDAEAAQRESERQELEKLRADNERLNRLKANVSAHVEINEETGEVKPKFVEKPKAPTQEELDRVQLSGEVTDTAVRIMDMNRQAEEAIINKHRGTPLFAEVLQKARERVNGVPAAQRTEKLWERALAMARGEMGDKIAKYHEEIGEKRALDRLRGQGAAIPQGGGGSGGSGGDGKVDLSKVVLTREQLNAANKMIDSGLLSSLDEYKKNAIEMGLAEVGQ